VQSFSVAATKSYGSGSSGHSTFSRWTSTKGDNQQSQSNNGSDKAAANEEEVSSPLKESDVKVGQDGAKGAVMPMGPLFQEKKKPDQVIQRKRKAKGAGEVSAAPAPNLNLKPADARL
jgi:hypothetical protein